MGRGCIGRLDGMRLARLPGYEGTSVRRGRARRARLDYRYPGTASRGCRRHAQARRHRSSIWIDSIDRQGYGILPPGRPPQGELIKEREPRWRRVSRHPSGLLSDPMVQSTPELPSIPGPSNSVEGISNVNGVLPPDTNGDVGPNHFVQMVNLSFAVYSKGTPRRRPPCYTVRRPRTRSGAGSVDRAKPPTTAIRSSVTIISPIAGS